MARPLWAGLPVSLAALSAELQKAFAEGLASHVQRLRLSGVPQEYKIINDPIWHTIRVESWELAIVKN